MRKHNQINFCKCSDFLYSNGKCASCGGWIDDPKEYAKNRLKVSDKESIDYGYCECEEPELHFSGICQGCRKKLRFEEFGIPDFESESSGNVVRREQDNSSSLKNDSRLNENFCSSCGLNIDKEHNYCSNCGAEVSSNYSAQNTLELVNLNKDSVKSFSNSYNFRAKKENEIQRRNWKSLMFVCVLLGLLAIFGVSKRDGSSGDVSTPSGRWVESCVTKEQPRTTNLITTCTQEWVQD